MCKIKHVYEKVKRKHIQIAVVKSRGVTSPKFWNRVLVGHYSDRTRVLVVIFTGVFMYEHFVVGLGTIYYHSNG